MRNNDLDDTEEELEETTIYSEHDESSVADMGLNVHELINLQALKNTVRDKRKLQKEKIASEV